MSEIEDIIANMSPCEVAMFAKMGGRVSRRQAAAALVYEKAPPRVQPEPAAIPLWPEYQPVPKQRPGPKPRKPAKIRQKAPRAEKVRETPFGKFCPRCHSWKMACDFQRDTRRRDGLSTNCKLCHNLICVQAWRRSRRPTVNT